MFYGGIKSNGGTFQGLENVLRVKNHLYSADIPPQRLKEVGKSYINNLTAVSIYHDF